VPPIASYPCDPIWYLSVFHPGMPEMTEFPDLIRSRSPSGENRYSLVDPLVASYLEFVAARTRPNTFDGPRPEPLARIWREGFEIGGYLPCQVVTQSRNSRS
jgi:hypothetical protein